MASLMVFLNFCGFGKTVNNGLLRMEKVLLKIGVNVPVAILQKTLD